MSMGARIDAADTTAPGIEQGNGPVAAAQIGQGQHHRPVAEIDPGAGAHDQVVVVTQAGGDDAAIARQRKDLIHADRVGPADGVDQQQGEPKNDSVSGGAPEVERIRLKLRRHGRRRLLVDRKRPSARLAPPSGQTRYREHSVRDLGLDKIVFYAETDELGGGSHPCLAHRRGPVAFNGLDADLQLAGDLLVGIALGDELSDL